MAFKDYLAKRRVGDNIQGDFVKDARADRNFPDAKTWAELKSYLRRRNACEGSLEAAQLVWSAYRAQVRNRQHL
ncbi:MAG: YozE family protein [Pseudomonadales bacterium]